MLRAVDNHRPVPRFVTVKITTNVAVGVYNALTFTPPGTAPGGALIETQLGTLAAAGDAYVWEPESIGLAAALPLTGLVTRGEIVGTNSSDGFPIVQIPPPGVREVRYNSLTDRIQVAYVSNPTEAEWVDKVNFTVCS